MTHNRAGVWIVAEEHLDDDGDVGARSLYGFFATEDEASQWMDAQPDDPDMTEMSAAYLNVVHTPPRYVIVADTSYYGNFDEDIAVTGPFATPAEALAVLRIMYPEEAGIAATVVHLGEAPSQDDIDAQIAHRDS